MAEYADVGVRVTLLIEEVDHHRRARRLAAPDHEASRLMDVCVEPRKEGGERARVEHPVALEAVQGSRACCQVGVEHPERARAEAAENCARSRLDHAPAVLEAVARRRGQCHVDGYMKRFLLACGE